MCLLYTMDDRGEPTRVWIDSERAAHYIQQKLAQDWSCVVVCNRESLELVNRIHADAFKDRSSEHLDLRVCAPKPLGTVGVYLFNRKLIAQERVAKHIEVVSGRPIELNALDQSRVIILSSSESEAIAIRNFFSAIYVDRELSDTFSQTIQ